MSEMKRLHALIEADSFDWLTEYSENNDISLAEAVRRAISGFKYAQDKRSFSELAASSGSSPLIDQPTADEDSHKGLVKRVAMLEYALHKVYRPLLSEIPSSEVYPVIPDYMKL